MQTQNVLSLTQKKKEKQVGVRNELNAMITAVEYSKAQLLLLEEKLKATKKKRSLSEKDFNSSCKELWNTTVSYMSNEMEIKETIKGLSRDMNKAVDLVVEEIREMKAEIACSAKENGTSINQELSKVLKLISGTYNDYIQVMNDETIDEFEVMIDKKVEETWSKK